MKDLALLKFGWLVMILTVLTIMGTFLLSEHSHKRQIDIVDEKIKKELGQKFDTNEKNKWNFWIIAFKYVSVLLFICGIVLLTIFYLQNIN